MLKFIRDRHGAVALTMGLMLPILASATLLTIDYANKVNVKTAAQRSADAAALAGARKMSADLLSGEQTEDSARERGRELARTLFEASLGETRDEVSGESSIDIREDREAKEIVATVTYEGEVQTLIPDFGIGWTDFKVETVARVPLRQRAEVHFLIDRSPSMGVGADPSDQSKMEAGMGCAFACHRGGGGPELAAQLGAKLRYDVVNEAATTALNQFKLVEEDNLDLLVAVHTFSTDFRTEISLTNDIEALSVALGEIEMASEEGQGGTDFATSFAQFSAALAASDQELGGRPPDSRYVVLLTDAVAGNMKWVHPTAHFFAPVPGFRAFEPSLRWNSGAYNNDVFTQGLDPTTCNPIKALPNTKLYVFQLEYTATSNPGSGEFVGQTLVPRMDENIRNCATRPSLVYQAEKSDEIEKNLDRLIRELIASLGLRIVE